MPDRDLIEFAEVLERLGEIMREEIPISGGHYTNSGKHNPATLITASPPVVRMGSALPHQAIFFLGAMPPGRSPKIK